jgi:hypothetical protein
MMEWYWQGKTEELEEKPVPASLCQQQTPHAMTRERTQASAVRPATNRLSHGKACSGRGDTNEIIK